MDYESVTTMARGTDSLVDLYLKVCFYIFLEEYLDIASVLYPTVLLFFVSLCCHIIPWFLTSFRFFSRKYSLICKEKGTRQCKRLVCGQKGGCLMMEGIFFAGLFEPFSTTLWPTTDLGRLFAGFGPITSILTRWSWKKVCFWCFIVLSPYDRRLLRLILWIILNTRAVGVCVSTRVQQV